MKLEHIALWTYRLEELKDFYTYYFSGRAGTQYINSKKGFSSYFLEFEEGARLELMEMPGIPSHSNDVYKQFTGLIHFAFEEKSVPAVDELTKRLADDGFEVIDGPRTTGDGYYESVILDPDKNRVEITYRLPS